MGLNLEQQHFENKSLMKNNSEKSIIYAPFNSSQSNYDEDKPELFQWPEEVLS